MDLIVRSHPALPARAWKAWRSRGAEYAWHKLLRRSLGRWPAWKRRWLYADPRQYWTLRGGDDYFREQEGQPARSRRMEWMADRLASYGPARSWRSAADTASCSASFASGSTSRWWASTSAPRNWSRPAATSGPDDGIELLLGRGEHLPFPDGAFDMVVTSAVILHNPPPVAERIRREVLRVRGGSRPTTKRPASATTVTATTPPPGIATAASPWPRPGRSPRIRTRAPRSSASPC